MKYEPPPLISTFNPVFRTLKLQLIAIGKTNADFIADGIALYVPRIRRYLPFAYDELHIPSTAGKLPVNKQLEEESRILLQALSPETTLVLFDERGKSLSSEAFAAFLQQKMNAGTRKLSFVLGGPFGFHPSIYERANDRVSLSPMTFPHQMVRLFAAEQIYRAFSILGGEPYHHA